VTPIETESSEIGQVRAAKEISDLPLNTRNFTQLVNCSRCAYCVGGASGFVVTQVAADKWRGDQRTLLWKTSPT